MCMLLVWSIPGGVIALGLCRPAVVGVGGSQVVISWCIRPTCVVGFESSLGSQVRAWLRAWSFFYCA